MQIKNIFFILISHLCLFLLARFSPIYLARTDSSSWIGQLRSMNLYKHYCLDLAFVVVYLFLGLLLSNVIAYVFPSWSTVLTNLVSIITVTVALNIVALLITPYLRVGTSGANLLAAFKNEFIRITLGDIVTVAGTYVIYLCLKYLVTLYLISRMYN